MCDGARLRLLRHIPPRVWWFQLRARLAAVLAGDLWSLRSTIRLTELGALIELFSGRTEVIEIGAGTGWTAISLALAEDERVVTALDRKDREIDRYLGLVGPEARSRVRVLRSAGDAVPERAGVDAVFIDSSHRHEDTVATFLAWTAGLAPGGVVVFHDYGHPKYPGVAGAVEELGLHGEAVGRLFVWRAP